MQRFTPFFGILLALVFTGAVALAQGQPGVQVTIAADLDEESATGIRIEGLVADGNGRLYTSDLDSMRLFRIDPQSGDVEMLGTLPRPASGMALDAAGNVYMASGDRVLRIASGQLGPNLDTAAVQTFATGVPGANGLAFGPRGELYVSGGATGNIYLVATDGMTRTWASGFRSEREAQQISTNGLAFGPDGKLYSSNTGTGAIDRITVNADGSAGQVERFVTNQLLFGADGIAFAANGDLYVAANERNAIVRVTPNGTVSDVTSNNNEGPLEFPASPAFVGTALYVSNFDIERGANSPNAPGIGASIARIDVGVAGAPLPARTQVPTTTPTPAVPPTPEPISEPTQVPPPPIEPPVGEPGGPLPVPTPVTPGMPTTGEGRTMPLLVLLVAVLLASAGIALRRRSRTAL